nr:hypothetical protein L203_02639 [Cryptococcus depauperatus CBS 7841]
MWMAVSDWTNLAAVIHTGQAAPVSMGVGMGCYMLAVGCTYSRWFALYHASWVLLMSMPLGDYFCEASSRGSWVVPGESKSDLASIPICICVRTWIDSRGSTDGLGTRIHSLGSYEHEVLLYISSGSTTVGQVPVEPTTSCLRHTHYPVLDFPLPTMKAERYKEGLVGRSPESQSKPLPPTPATHSSAKPVSFQRQPRFVALLSRALKESLQTLFTEQLLHTFWNKAFDSIRFKHRILLIDTRISTIDSFTDP